MIDFLQAFGDRQLQNSEHRLRRDSARHAEHESAAVVSGRGDSQGRAGDQRRRAAHSGGALFQRNLFRIRNSFPSQSEGGRALHPSQRFIFLSTVSYIIILITHQ